LRLVYIQLFALLHFGIGGGTWSLSDLAIVATPHTERQTHFSFPLSH
jgi:hypothetical protein